jgi:hypothetical protein
MNQYDELVAALEEISGQIDDLSLTQLREDIAEGRTRSSTDRDLMRARRAVEKAAGIMRQLSQDSGSPQEI